MSAPKLKKETDAESAFCTYSLKSEIKNIIAEFFHFDRRIIRTLRVLLFQPWKLMTSNSNPLDDTYIAPLKLYLAVNFVFFLLIPLLSTPNFEVFSFNLESFVQSNTSFQTIVTEQIERMQITPEIYTERFNAHIKYNQSAWIFLMIPFYAVILALLNVKNHRPFIDYLHFSTYFLSSFLIQLLLSIALYRTLCAAIQPIVNVSSVLGLVFICFLLLGLVYFLFQSHKLYIKNSWLLSGLKSVILLILFFVTFSGYVQFLFYNTLIALRLGY